MDGDSGVISLSSSLNDIVIDDDEKSLSGLSIADVYPMEDFYRRKSIEQNALTKILQRPSMEELHLGRGFSTSPNASVSNFKSLSMLKNGQTTDI